MDPVTRAQIERALDGARRLVPEFLLDPAFARQTKSALRQAAEEKGLDLSLERVSLWREEGERGFRHLASCRDLYTALRQADYFPEEIFVLDSPGGEILTFLTRRPGEGNS